MRGCGAEVTELNPGLKPVVDFFENSTGADTASTTYVRRIYWPMTVRGKSTSALKCSAAACPTQSGLPQLCIHDLGLLVPLSDCLGSMFSSGDIGSVLVCQPVNRTLVSALACSLRASLQVQRL